MKRKIILTVILIMTLSLLINIYYSDGDLESKSYGLNDSSIAIMVYDHETDNYIKQSNVPKGAKYSLNEELTNCEAGGKVTNYSKANGTLNYELKKADKCYVYFDVDNTPSYAIYSETDNSLIFYKNNDEVGSTYNGRAVTAKYDDIENSVYTYVNKVPNTPWYEYANVIKTISVANEIKPISTENWFNRLLYVENIDLTGLDTSYVVNMERMFDRMSYSSNQLQMNLGKTFDTSNVIDMDYMFQTCGNLVTNQFVLDLGDKFDTSCVTSMQNMFTNLGANSQGFELILGDKFDTSSAVNMSAMFASVGRRSLTFYLDLGNKFDTSNVTDMDGMFYETGKNNPNFLLNLGDKFDTSNVTNMYRMFGYAGYSNPNFELDLSNFVIQMSCNLTEFASNSATKIIFGEGWSNASLVSGMFGYDSSTPIEIVNAPANIQSYDFAADNRVVTFTTI